MEKDLLNKVEAEFYGAYLYQEPLKNHTSFKIGGPCDLMLVPDKMEKLRSAIEDFNRAGEEIFILGKGTNLLVRDGGLRATVIKIGGDLAQIKREGSKIYAQSGALLSQVAKEAMRNGLTGFEEISGIPGSIGGAVIMNAGAYGKEIKDLVEYVDLIDEGGREIRYSREEMDFSYRHSRAQDENLVVAGASFSLEIGDPSEIEKNMGEYKKRRREKQPLEYPSAGSTFKRPEGYYAGKLIQDSGMRGYSINGAQVSEKHSGFVINKGGASAKDVTDLIELIQKRVKEKFGVSLETEVKIIGEEG